VDDDPDALTLLRLLLRSEGFEVQAALSGPAALQCVRQQMPDLYRTRPLDARTPACGTGGWM
jgi:CheY-like chemotaxis protein